NESLCYPIEDAVFGITKASYTLPQLIRKPLNLANTWAEIGVNAGDVNGDGYGDVYFVDDSNSVVLYFGSGGGLIANAQPRWIPVLGRPQLVTKTAVPVGFNPSTNYCANCSLDYAEVRSILVKAGDFNGDGYSDVVIGNPSADSPSGVNTNPASPFL